MEDIKSDSTFFEWSDLNDGELFGVQEVDPETGIALERIIMPREIAIQMAIDILQMSGEHHAILPPTK